MALSDITYAKGDPADNPSPIEETYIDGKGRSQYKVTRVLLSTAPTTDASTIAQVHNGAPLKRLISQGRGVNGAEAVFTAIYDTNVVGGETQVEEAMKPQQMWVANPSGKLYWPDGKRLRQDEFGAEYPIFGWTYVLEYTSLLSMPSFAAGSIGGCIAGGMNSSFGSFGAETLLYGSPAISSVAKMGSGKRYSATYSYAFNPFGWNKWWCARAGGWYNLYFDKNAGTRYIYYPLV